MLLGAALSVDDSPSVIDASINIGIMSAPFLFAGYDPSKVTQLLKFAARSPADPA
jgi:hypothetical protein